MPTPLPVCSTYRSLLSAPALSRITRVAPLKVVSLRVMRSTSFICAGVVVPLVSVMLSSSSAVPAMLTPAASENASSEPTCPLR